jgi:uncharacterized membrane protein
VTGLAVRFSVDAGGVVVVVVVVCADAAAAVSPSRTTQSAKTPERERMVRRR